MIPVIDFAQDCQVKKIEGDLVPTMYIRYVVPAHSTIGQGDWHIFVTSANEVPDSFAKGMREIQEGHAIDFDTALREPPPAE